MNGGRHGPPITAEGCVSAIGWFFVLFLALGLTMVSLGWFFFAPPDICDKFETVQVIEKTKEDQDIVVNKDVCSRYKPSPVPSPFWRIWEWAKP